MLVHEVLAAAAALHADAVAVEGPDGTRTYADLLERATRLADGWHRLGLRPGDRVLEAVPNGCALLESDLALSAAGLVRVPLNPRLGPREWAAIARDSGASALLVADGLRTADGSRPQDCVGVPLVVRTGAAAGGGPTVEDLVASGREGAGTAGLDQDDLVGLAYSSGTTGRPKGARRTHRMRVRAAEHLTRSVLGASAGPGAVHLHAGPAIHTSGLFVLPMLSAGGRQVMLDHPDPAAIVTALESYEVTHTAVVPTVLAALVQEVRPRVRPFPALRMLAYAGAPASPTLLRAAHATLTPSLVQYYGLVEAMPPLAVLDAADHAGDDELLRSAGRVVEGIRLEVRDDAGRVVPDGATGEVWVSGDVVTPGYWAADARADLGKAVVDGWLATGDVGHRRGDRLWLTDRRADMIITGGYNVYPREVEDVVAAVPGVTGCAAVGLPDERWGQRIVVAYTADGPLDEATIAAACLVLAPHKRPKQLLRRPSLPLGATAKVDRRTLATVLVAVTSGDR